MKLKLLISLAVVILCGCTKENITAQTMTEKLYVTIGEETRSVTMEDNVGTQALVAALQTENITYEAHDYGNFEKVGDLGLSFPTADHQVTTSASDIVLYNGNNICIFYGSNSWSYTRIGKLDGMSAEDVRRFVNAGGGNVMITLSLQPIHTGLDEFSDDKHGDSPVYTITGQIAPKGYRGIVISFNPTRQVASRCRKMSIFAG